MKSTLNVRPSPLAGKWYPADPQQLAQEVDQYIGAAKLPALSGEVVAIMVPHAGHRYSGPVAGFAFKALTGLTPDLVAVISPMHYVYSEPLLTSAHTAYETPLGVVPVDTEALAALDQLIQQELGYGLAQVARDPEHSLEIELPFLQRVLTQPFQLLPVMVRDQTAQTARALGNSLARVLAGRKAVLVASTDLSHFYPQSVANRLDANFLGEVAAFDPLGVLQIEEQGLGFACGRAALAAVLWAAKGLGADRVQILQHATSGDVTGDYDQVVGYGSAVISRTVMES